MIAAPLRAPAHIIDLSASHDNDRQVDDLPMLMIWLLDEFILYDAGDLSLLSDGSCHGIPELSCVS